MMPHGKHRGEGMNQETGGFGASVPMTTGSGALNPVPIINQPQGLRLAQTFTVMFALTVPLQRSTDPSPGTPAPANCQALIQWVENGQQVQRLVTVGNGVSVSGSGTGVQISLTDLPFGTGYISGIPYQVTALVVPGLRPSFSLPLYVPITTFELLASSSVGIPIPQGIGVRAVEVSVVNLAAPTPPEVLVQALGIGALYKAWDPLTLPGMTPVPAASTNLFITNRDAANAVTVTVLFGIDG